MKLKSLLAIVSCTAIALSISLPSIAETVKDSKVESTSIGIGNKDYRNKQFTPSIVGSWKSVVNEHNKVSEIYVTFGSNGTFKVVSQPSGYDGNGVWSYSDGYLTEHYTGKENPNAPAPIKWISNDEFIITIVDNGNPYYEGAQRRYYRQPVQTSRQKLEQLRKLEETEGQFNAIPHNTGIIIDTFGGGLYTGN